MDEREEFISLWTVAQPVVAGFILSVIPRFEDADDVLQDVSILRRMADTSGAVPPMKASFDLIERHLDGELEPGEHEALIAWLEADPEHLRAFLREVHLQRELRNITLARPYTSTGRSNDGVVPVAAETPSYTMGTDHGVGPRTRCSRWQVAAAIVLLLGFGIAIWLGSRQLGPEFLLRAHSHSCSLFRRDGSRIETADRVRVRAGERIETGQGVATLGFGPDQLILLPNTQLAVIATGRRPVLDLGSGAVQAWIAPQRSAEPLVIITPHCRAIVLGTDFHLESAPTFVGLEVYEGAVRLERPEFAEFVEVDAGFSVVVGSDWTPEKQPIAQGVGQITWEYWLDVQGTSIDQLRLDPRFPDAPGGRVPLERFEMPADWDHNYGSRVRGYLHPPATGAYTFWISADDSGELWLSTDEDSQSAERICYTPGFNWRPFSWDEHPEQRSMSVTLEAGARYYIEALHKEGGGTDSLAVAWEGPGLPRQVIEGRYLSPPAYHRHTAGWPHLRE